MVSILMQVSSHRSFKRLAQANLELADILHAIADKAESARIWRPTQSDEIVCRRDWMISARNRRRDTNRCGTVFQSAIKAVPDVLECRCCCPRNNCKDVQKLNEITLQPCYNARCSSAHSVITLTGYWILLNMAVTGLRLCKVC